MSEFGLALAILGYVFLRQFVRLAMQYIGDTMPLGWDLVRHMESNPKIDPKLGIDGDEVRKQEKDMMTYQSEC